MNASKTVNPNLSLIRTRQLLEMEYQFEKTQFLQQTELIGIEKKVRQGICWFPVTAGRSYYNSLNQLVVEIERHSDLNAEHAFEFGKSVGFFTQDAIGNLRFFNFNATVNYADEKTIVAVLPSTSALAELQGAGQLGIQLHFDETSYQTMFEALEDVIRAKDNRLAGLRDIILGNIPVSQFNFSSLRFPWLNKTQEEAVNKVLRAKDVAIVHGPPGTGKTTTLVEAIYETLHRENQILVCAQSNMAVDWISEKLTDRGINVLRIGNPSRVNDKMLSFTYERRFEAHPDYPELWGIRKTIRSLYAQMRKTSGREALRQKINSLKDRATELEIRINESLFNEARVVASTLVSSNHRILTGKKFSTLFIDEAAQALEAACWIAIRKADRVILAGDHQQLPPTIKCLEASRGGLSETLMEKIVTQKPSTVSLLSMQYRMNEEIMNFPSRWFYQGKLEAAPEVKYRGILDWDSSLVWIDTGGEEYAEEFVTISSGRINKPEALLLMEQLEKYIIKIGKERILDERIDFEIISPYKAQVHYLRSLFRHSAFFKPFRSLISINSVDGFQGQERDVILISLVRANEEGQIGFLKDLRRMNVAITRARMKLIIIGDGSTLSRQLFYRKLYEYIGENGKIMQTH